MPHALDKRTRADILSQAAALAAQSDYVPDWGGIADPGDPGWHLAGQFARLMELLIERTNRMPERNFMAFLDYVGVEAAPGRAAEVPVTFQLSKKIEIGALVPAGTQLATTQTTAAVAEVFETEGPFFASPAKLGTAVNLVPGSEIFSVVPPPDLPITTDNLIVDPARPAVLSPTAAGTDAVPHTLFLAQPALFGRADPVDVILSIWLTGPQRSLFADGRLIWRRYDADLEDWVDLEARYLPTPQPDRVQVFLPALSQAAEVEVGGEAQTWIAAHRVDAATPLALPTLRALTGHFQSPGSVPVTDQPVAMFANAVPLDPSTPVQPFGARPGYGDTLYIGSDAAIAPDVAAINLSLTLSGYGASALLSRFAGIIAPETIETRIDWQYLSDSGDWRALPGLTAVTHQIQADPGPPLTVTSSGNAAATLNASAPGQTFSLAITLPPDVGRGEVNGVEAGWIRAILRSQAPYGSDTRLVEIAGTPPTVRAVGPTFVPPILEAITLTRTYRIQELPITSIRTDSALQRNHILPDATGAVPPVAPFVPTGTRPELSPDPALYFSLDRPTPDAFLSLYFDIEPPQQAAGPQIERGNPEIVWEYRAAPGEWRALDAQDGTADLTGGGTLGFLWPGDALPEALFSSLDSSPAYWFRARLVSGSYTVPPRLRQILPNTVMARNAQTHPDRVIGSGNGTPAQIVRLRTKPLLEGTLWVREAEVPGPDQGLPDDAIDVRPGTSAAQPQQIWVRWQRVATFAVSGPDDRHYTLEITTGVLSFGTGVAGMIPPVAKDNLVLRDLRTGGGEAANAAALPLRVKELKTSLPFIDKVANVVSAEAGADPWDIGQIGVLGPQTIRTRGRAVSVEDYEWLVRTSFSQIARVRGMAVRAPGPGESLVFRPGAVTLIVVPKGTGRTPQPSTALLQVISERLSELAYGAIGPEIHVVPPSYRPIGIAATLRPLDPGEASQVQRRAVAALEAFLHPLTGGEGAAGWDFGRTVHLSEIYAVLQRVEGVDRVLIAAFVDQPAAATAIPIPENAIAASGAHQIGVG